MLYDERSVQHIFFDYQEPLNITTPLRQNLKMSKNIKKKISKNVVFCYDNTVNDI